MSSTANPLAFYQSLYSCQVAADSCVDEADEALRQLRDGLSDVARFKQISEFNRHFILISESEVNNAKSSLAADIEPQIRNLTTRAETALNNLLIRQDQLKHKAIRRQELAYNAKSNLSPEDAGILQKLSLQKERYQVQIADEEAQLRELEEKLQNEF
ncbi:hypothetical protein E3Q22_03423 [Wallemia mellicola]|uniref:DASH complex subunit SPC19 n=1 Tax=Wallemia mellicola TaxID=1708541 RepID=A0A4T0MH27_9BASI|nr:hypothetical protein E3Q24_03538 [Wallemia mellicola]TIB76691.1 hypothetical protein E3Q22_03423 [Wallemia mellicola]TIB82580.1 hypothetical protein E3Q21_03356 [Wallemia mellicola]TIB85261.1 hypothetical protein E3Q20_03332 [Wallemia mellicola]TIB97510.1 hypothetical protein E3Q17_03366 [Wallemia mellicola]